MSDFHDSYMKTAQAMSTMSLDPSTKVGCVIRLDDEIVSLGYNKIPVRIPHTVHDMENREWKYPRIIHAEQDAIMKLQKDAHILGRLRLYCTTFPCHRCAGMIIHAGIHEVFTFKVPLDVMERWGPSMNISADMFKEANIPVTFLDV